MAKKVKIVVLTDKVRFRLPGLPIGLVLWAVPKMIDHSLERHDVNAWWFDNKQYWKAVFRQVKLQCRSLEPFTLVEVDSAEAQIRIEVK